MKTAEQVKTRVNELIKTGLKEQDPVEQAKIKAEISYLNKVYLYLSTNPSETFIRTELQKLQKRIDLINQNYKNWTAPKGVAYGKLHKVYEKAQGVPKLNESIQFLSFLLN